MSTQCKHLDQIREVTPGTDGCEECLKTGGRWVHLRMCLVCGHVGCCDSSPGRHATHHFEDTEHAVMQSADPAKAGVGATSTGGMHDGALA